MFKLLYLSLFMLLLYDDDDRYTIHILMMRLLVKIFYSLLGVVKLFYVAAVS